MTEFANKKCCFSKNSVAEGSHYSGTREGEARHRKEQHHIPMLSS